MDTGVHSSPPGIFKTNIPGGDSSQLPREPKNEYRCLFLASWDIQDEYDSVQMTLQPKNEYRCSFLASWDMQKEYPRRGFL